MLSWIFLELNAFNVIREVLCKLKYNTFETFFFFLSKYDENKKETVNKEWMQSFEITL